MKAGWKNRIDERRYFDEKKEAKRQSICKRMESEASMQMLNYRSDMAIKSLAKDFHAKQVWREE